MDEIEAKDAEIQEMNEAILSYMSEASNNKAELEHSRRDAIDLNLQIEELEKKLQTEKDLNTDIREKYEEQLKALKQKNDELRDEISEWEAKLIESQASSIKLQSRVNQEVRLWKASELARDNAVTNLKNAYALMNPSESWLTM